MDECSFYPLSFPRWGHWQRQVCYLNGEAVFGIEGPGFFQSFFSGMTSPHLGKVSSLWTFLFFNQVKWSCAGGSQHQKPRNGLQHPNSLISWASNKWEAGEPDRAATWSHGRGLPWGPAHIEWTGTSAIHISQHSPGPHLPCQPAEQVWPRFLCFTEKIYSSRLTYMDVCI